MQVGDAVMGTADVLRDCPIGGVARRAGATAGVGCASLRRFGGVVPRPDALVRLGVQAGFSIRHEVSALA